MGYNIKFNEWQEMSLKKDVEKIVSILSQKRTLETSVLWEAFFALLAMVLDHTNFISAFPISAALLIYCSVFSVSNNSYFDVKSTKETNNRIQNFEPFQKQICG